MSTPPVVNTNVDETVFLIGRPPIGEYLGFITQMAINGQQIPQRVLAQEWRTANDHVKTLEASEAGIANNAPIEQVPPSQAKLAQGVRDDPVFQNSFQMVPTDVGIVELDRLVVYQKFINLGYVRMLQGGLGKKPSADDVFRFCLPVDHPIQPVRVMQVAQNAFTFISPSNDFRFLEAKLFSPTDLTNAPGRVATSILGLFLGYGANFLTVASVENRLILMNGSHRAYALRELGITKAPCLIQRVSRREELETILQGEVSQKPDLYLTAPRPPLLKDYFDSALRKLVPVVRKDRLVRVSYGVEQFDIPAN